MKYITLHCSEKSGKSERWRVMTVQQFVDRLTDTKDKVEGQKSAFRWVLKSWKQYYIEYKQHTEVINVLPVR